MKLSKIQQIIKEEVAKAISEVNDEYGKAMDKFKEKVGFKEPTGGPGNQLKVLPLEKLPNYDQLPETEEEVKDSPVKVLVNPHIRIEGVGSIFSKEAAKKAKKQIQDYWTEDHSEPLFTYRMKKLSKDEYTNEITFAELANGNEAFKKKQQVGPGPEANLGDYYGPGSKRYSGD